MSNPFLGMMINVGFNFAPRGWAACDGQLLAISQNDALYALLGTTYGGDGQNTFGLPDLRGRRQLHAGQTGGTSNYVQGEMGGTESTTILQSNMPAHSHVATFANTSTLTARNAKGTTNSPTAGYQLSRTLDGDGTATAVPFIYAPVSATNQVALGGFNFAGTNTVTNGVAGGSQPTSTIQPYNTILACISLEGIFPSRN